MSLFDSVLIGAYCRHGLKSAASRRAWEVLELMGLTGKAGAPTGKLNMFDRKKSELAVALATEPSLLLLDELFAGCTPTEAESLSALLLSINEMHKISLFIVEHVLKIIMSLCKKVVVLDYGEVIGVGSPAEITKSPKVLTAYLGEDYDVSQDQ
jgi:branched-chain amino acid transport system ATP-binding protein